MTSDFDMHGKNVLVTGGLGLIGREICDALAGVGANLYLTDAQHENKIEAYASELSAGYDIACYSAQADISDPDAVNQLVANAASAMGSVDTFVHCAGVDTRFDGTDVETPPTAFHEFPLYAWERSVDINMTGTMLVAQAVVGEKQNKPIDYVATKSMVPNFVRYLGASYAESGIRVNCVAPHGIANNHPGWFKQNFAELTPIARMCEPSELRGPFLLLASDASSYMTGSTLVVDGGWTAW